MQPTYLKTGDKIINNKSKSQKNSITSLEQQLKKLIKKTPKFNKLFSNYLKNQNINSFLFDKVTKDEIESMIGNLNSRIAVGPNSIPTRIVQEFQNILKIALALIINISFQTGIFPKECKIAHITAIFKKGDKIDSSNTDLFQSYLISVKSLKKQCT